MPKKNCLVCNKEMIFPKCLKDRKKYCSKICQNTPKIKRLLIKCPTCSKEFKERINTTKYCSSLCHRTRPKKSLLNRYNKFVIRNNENECWGWNGSTADWGYGLIRVNNKCIRAHRISWELKNGFIPKGLYVLHICDNPPCTNPNHLFLGTIKDNTHDMMKKGRGRNNPNFGEKHHNSVLTNETVVSIKKMINDGNKPAEIAKRFNTNIANIYSIRSGKGWKHIT